jgi:hypothetical protein
MYKTRNACVAGLCEMLQGLLLLVALPPLHDRLSERVQTVPVRPTVQIGRPPQVWQITPSGASGAGNVTVVLSGAALVDYGDVRCKFCSVEVRGYVLHSGAVSCIAPPASAIPSRDGSERANVILPTACIVDVTLHGPDGYTGGSTVVFHYFNISQVTVALMQPSGGPPLGGTVVRLKGTRFADHGGGGQGPKCRFGSVVVPATVESSDAARCLSPPLPQLAVVAPQPVGLTLNGNTDEQNTVGGLTFRYAKAATLSEIAPLGGPLAGGQTITLRGLGLVDDSAAEAVCQMGVDTLCLMHRHAVGMRIAEQPRPGLACIFESRSLPNRYDDAPPPLDDAIAVHGSLQSGIGGMELLCNVPNDLQRLARPVGPWCAHHGVSPHCDDPAYAASSMNAVGVRVTLNGNVSDASPTALVYLLYPPEAPRLHYATPWGGPSAGGTLVHVVGEDLLALGVTPLCRFGHIEVPMQSLGGMNGSTAMESSPLHTRMLWHDERSRHTIEMHAGRLLTCRSPEGALFGGRWVRVSVALDGEHFSRDTVPFRYTSLSVVSAHPTGGTLSGGTKVIVRGLAFEDFGGLRCVFGNQSVPASRVDDDHRALRCDSPAVATAGTVPLSISVNGDLNSASLERGNVTFSYFDASGVVISSLSPTSGPNSGGRAITLHGAGFAVLGTVQCRFGDHAPVNASYATAGPGQVLPQGHILDRLVCFSPTHNLSNNDARSGGDHLAVAISLSGDSVDFVGDGQLGLKWAPVSVQPPLQGELVNLKLSQALRQGRRSFLQSDLDAFGLRNGGTGAFRPHDTVKWTSHVEAGGKWFKPAAGPLFFSYHPCHGRNSMAYYTDSVAKAAVLRYLSVNHFNMTHFDVDGDGVLNAEEVRLAIASRNETVIHSSSPSTEVLNAYASSTCFIPTQAGDRKLARYDDYSAGDETGGLMFNWPQRNPTSS